VTTIVQRNTTVQEGDADDDDGFGDFQHEEITTDQTNSRSEDLGPPKITNIDLPMIPTSTTMDTSKVVVADYSNGHLTKENISPDKVNDVLHKRKRSYTQNRSNYGIICCKSSDGSEAPPPLISIQILLLMMTKTTPKVSTWLSNKRISPPPLLVRSVPMFDLTKIFPKKTRNRNHWAVFRLKWNILLERRWWQLVAKPVVVIEREEEDDNFQNDEEAAAEDTEPLSFTFCTREALLHPAETADSGGVECKGEDTPKVEPNAVNEEKEEEFSSFEDLQMIEVAAEDIEPSTEMPSGQGPENPTINKGGGVDENEDEFSEFDDVQTVEVEEDGEPSSSMHPGEPPLNPTSTVDEKGSGTTGVKDEYEFGDFNEPGTGKQWPPFDFWEVW